MCAVITALFCLTLGVGRGTPEKPGLMLGIDRGGSCTGVAHRIAADEVESELSILWLREMMSGAYEPRWVNADVDGHGRTRVLTFVINRSHPRYEGALPEDEVARAHRAGRKACSAPTASISIAPSSISPNSASRTARCTAWNARCANSPTN